MTLPAILPKTASMREVQRNYKSLFFDVKKKKEALYLLSNSQPEVVVLDIETYENLVKTVENAEKLRLQQIIQQGDNEYQNRTTKTGNLKNLLA